MEAGLAGEPKPYRRRLPDERRAITHKFQVSGHEGYITVGLYPDGQPGEIFLKMAKEGSTVSGLMDSMATMTSIALQYGVPLRDLVNKFGHVRFEPAGFTGNSEIPIAKSIVDYVFRWLGSRFLGKDERDALGIISRPDVDALPESPQGGSAPPAAGSAGLNAVGTERDPGAPENRGVSAFAMNLSPTTESTSQGISGEGGKPDDSPKADALGQSTDTGSGQSIGEVGGPKTSAVTADPPPAGATGGTDLPVLSQAPALGNGHTTDSKPIKPLDLGGGTKVAFSVSADSPSCADCGSIMVRNGSCYKCLNCGSTSGCS
jgi:ribonucleoside-diphosphate reductase alpha chain